MRKAIAFTILLALAIIAPILNTSGHTSASSSTIATEFVFDGHALQQQTPAPVGAGSSVNAPYKRICKGETIPDGWVITALLADSTNCPGTESYREYSIKDMSSFPVNSGQLICKNSKVPKGWRVVRKYSISKECPNVGSMVILRRR
jgi:hypothetical protein